MIQDFKTFSLSELDDMIPWEREIYIHLLNQYIEEKNNLENQTKNQLGL